MMIDYLTTDHNVELFDTLESELFLLDQNAHRISHELLGHVEHVLWHGGRKQDHLNVVGHLGEHVVDLLLETARQHLVGFVQHEQFDVFRVFKI